MAQDSRETSPSRQDVGEGSAVRGVSPKRTGREPIGEHSNHKEDGDVGRGKEDDELVDMHTYIQDDILEQVEECLREWGKEHATPSPVAGDPFHRCAVCTLPHGTCSHTKEWIESVQGRKNPALDSLPKDEVSLAMDDISDVLQAAPAPPVSALLPPNTQPAFQTLRWTQPPAQPADEISGVKVDLSSPAPRGGATLVLLDGKESLRDDTRLLVLYGGFSMASGGVFQPYSTVVGASPRDAGSAPEVDAPGSGTAGGKGVDADAVVYHTDAHVFRVGLSSWHRPPMVGDLPGGRDGHVAVALEGQVMWLFGGRGGDGALQKGDTYLLHTQDMRWERTNGPEDRWPGPCPRVWSAAVKVRGHVLLFGGTDLRGRRSLNDLWVWDSVTRRWAEQVTVGVPPLPRFGHALLACPGGRRVVVLGGCCVSTTDDEGLAPDHERRQLHIRVAADMVTRAYELEDAEAALGGLASYVELRSSLAGGQKRTSGPGAGGGGGGGRAASFGLDSERLEGGFATDRWKDLSRRQAQLAADIASRERGTELLEEELRRALYEDAVAAHWARLRSRHPLPHMDLTFLDVDGMVWEPPPPAACRRGAPCARMHFAAVTLGNKLVVWGGCAPTAGAGMALTEDAVHVLDLATLRWTSPLGEGNPSSVRPCLEAAKSQLRRARRALLGARAHAASLGAPGGYTVQVAEAEAVAAVNLWRVRAVAAELTRTTPSPAARAAHAGCAVGQRIMIFGGWLSGPGAGGVAGDRVAPAGAEGWAGGGAGHGTGAGGGAVASEDSLLVLDVEQPDERERRLEDEFHLRLERERRAREAEEAARQRRRELAERMRSEVERAREAEETRGMAAEDARSAIAPLTAPSPPRLRCANPTTLWLEWDEPLAGARGRPCQPGTVEYILYMRGGFREWQPGDRVMAYYLSHAARKLEAAAGASSAAGSFSLVPAWEPGAGPGGEGGGGWVEGGQGRGAGGRGGGPTVPASARSLGSHASSSAASSGVCSVRSVGSQRDTDELLRLSVRGAGGSTRPALYAATVTGVQPGGLFDLRWSDGERERGAARWRLHPAEPPPWTVVYRGRAPQYELSGMVPEVVLERERRHPYEIAADFALQTLGTEWPAERLSRHSPVVTLRTDCHGQGPCQPTPGPASGFGGVGGSPLARDASLSVLSAVGSVTSSVAAAAGTSSGHVMHGVYVAAGQGAFYV